MIVTITLNPAIDIRYTLERLAIDSTNRCASVGKTAGGKGLNVSRVISLAGEKVNAAGFLGGPNGQWIAENLTETGIGHRFTEIKGETRNCIAILHEGNQTEILEPGPSITEDEQRQFITDFMEAVKECEVVVASGSLPAGVDVSLYKEIVEITKRNNKKIIMDTSGKALEEVIKAKPTLIKPNTEELEALFGEAIKSREQLKECMAKLAAEGIEVVVVSMGGDGALALYEGEYYHVQPPAIEVVNAVGSGDSTVAGFAIGLSKDWAIEETLRFGCALGTLNALEERTGYIDRENIKTFVEKTTVVKL